jgi:hypothetical protein
LEQLEEDKRRKAAEWYKQQLESGGGAANPNLMPIGYNGAAAGVGGSSGGFAVPAPKKKEASSAGWRDRLAAKY